MRDLLDRDLGTLRPMVQWCVDHADKLHSEQTIPMACDWRIAIENTLEDAHVAHIHRDSLAKLGLKLGALSKHGKNSIASYIIQHKALRNIAAYFPHADPSVYFHVYLYPSTCLSSVGGFTFSWQEYLPAGSGKTVLTTRLYSGMARDGGLDLAFFFDAAAKFNRQVFEEDARLCERIHLRCTGQKMRPGLERLQWFAEARNAVNVR